MRKTQHSKLGWILIAILIIMESAQAVEDEQLQSYQGFNCSSKLSLIDKEEFDLMYTKNMEVLSLQLIDGNELISKLIKDGPAYTFKLLENYKQFVWNFLKLELIICFILLAYILATQRGRSFAKISFFQSQKNILSKINSKIISIVPILLAAILLVLFCSTLRALAIVSSQPTNNSELSCLISTGPKLRMKQGELQKWLSFDEVIELLSSKEVYFEENPLQLALFADYRLDMQQNLRISQFIRNSIIAEKADKSYLLQLNSFINAIEQLVKIQQISKTYELKTQFQRYYSSYVEGSKILNLIHKTITSSKITTFFTFFQITLLSVSFITGFSLIYLLIKFGQGQDYIQKYFISMRVFIICLAFFCFLLFSITSMMISGVYWMDTGLIKQIQNNGLLNKIESVPILSDFLLKFLPNSREVSQKARNSILVKANKYYQLINPIAQKSDNYYYHFFNQSIKFLREADKQIMAAELQQSYIKNLQLVSQSRIARDTFHQMITNLDSHSLLNSIQFGDYGRYFLKITAQFKKLTFTNTYSLRRYYGYAFIAFLLIYLISFISFSQQNKDKDRSLRLPQSQNFEDPEGEVMSSDTFK